MKEHKRIRKIVYVWGFYLGVFWLGFEIGKWLVRIFGG